MAFLDSLAAQLCQEAAVLASAFMRDCVQLPHQLLPVIQQLVSHLHSEVQWTVHSRQLISMEFYERRPGSCNHFEGPWCLFHGMSLLCMWQISRSAACRQVNTFCPSACTVHSLVCGTLPLLHDTCCWTAHQLLPRPPKLPLYMQDSVGLCMGSRS